MKILKTVKVIVLIISVATKCKVNPDNVATPIAASLGDLVTLALLYMSSSYVNDSGGSNLASGIITGNK